MTRNEKNAEKNGWIDTTMPRPVATMLGDTLRK